MNRTIAFLLLTFSICNSGQSQSIYPTKFDDCKTGYFFLEGKEINTKYQDEKLLNDLLTEVDAELISKIKGTIYFQVFVDTVGNHCCVSMDNKLNGKGKKIDFKSIINNHTKWEIPIKDGRKSPISAMFKVEFRPEEIVLIRLGFNGKTGWIKLSEFSLKKN